MIHTALPASASLQGASLLGAAAAAAAAADAATSTAATAAATTTTTTAPNAVDPSLPQPHKRAACPPSPSTARGPGAGPRPDLTLDRNQPSQSGRGGSGGSPRGFPLQETPPVPVPCDLDDLVRLLRVELGSDGLDSDRVDVNRIMAIMAAYQSDEKHWAKYAYYDRFRYTRNLVDDGNGKFNLMVLAWGQKLRSGIHDHANSHCLMKVLDGTLTEETFEWPETTPVNSVAETAAVIVDDGPGEETEVAADGLPTVTAATSSSSCAGRSEPSNAIGQEQGTGRNCGGVVVMKPKWVREYNRDEVAYIHDKMGLHRISNRSAEKPAVSLHLYTPPFSEVHTFTESGDKRKGGTMCYYSVKGKKVERDF